MRPKVGYANGARFLAMSRTLVNVLDSELPTLTTSAPEGLPAHFAALALTRAARLLDAMLVLRERDLVDVSDLPLWPLTEHLTLGMYLLYGEEKAFEHMRGAHVFDLEKLDPGNEERSTLPDRWTGPRDRLNWRDLMLTVVPRLVAEKRDDESAAESFRGLYDQIYRGQSLLVAHAGVGTLQRHLTIDDEGTRGIRVTGYLPDDGTGAVVMAAALVALLAVHVWLAFDRDPSAMQVVYDELCAPLAVMNLPDE